MGIGLITALMLRSAEATEWYHRYDVGAVSIVNAEGFVPQGDLQSLLSVQVGEPFDPVQVRRDLSTLYTMGEFQSISVDVLNDSIDSEPFLHVRYNIAVSPRLSAVSIDADNRKVKKLLKEKLPYSLGQVFHPALELWKLEQYLKFQLEAVGYVGVDLKLDFEERNKEIALSIQVIGVRDNRFASIQAVNLPKELKRPYQKLLRKYSIEKGELVQIRRINDFKLAVQDLLHRSGWLDAKVRLLLQETPSQEQELKVLIEPQKRVDLTVSQFDGGFRLRRTLESADFLRNHLNLYSGIFLSDSDIPRLTESLLQWLETKGYLDATVNLSLQESAQLHMIVADVQVGNRHEITDIVFSESSLFTAPELLSTFTLEHEGLKPGLLVNGLFNPAQVQKGVQSVEQAYIATGYLDVDVALNDEIRSSGTVSLHSLKMDIDVGKQYRLGLVSVDGGLDSINESVVVELSGVYQPHLIEEGKRKLQQIYQDTGFLYATVSVDTTITQTGIVDVEYTVQKGDKVLLRNIGVRGNRLTKREVIDDVVRLTPGTALSPSIIEDIRYDLNALELFESTTVRLIGDTPQQQDLLITVEERPQWAVGTGGSLATDLGVLAIGSVHNRNIGGNGRQASVLGQFGYAWTDDAWRFDSTEPIWRLASTYIAPRTPLEMSNVRIESIFQEIVQQPNYRIVQSGMGIGLGLAPSNEVNFLIEYRLRRMELDDVEPSLLLEGEPWSMLLTTDVVHRWWSGVQSSIVLDYRNDPFNPTRGFVLSGDVRIGDGLLNDLPTVRLTGGMTTLLPMDNFRWKVSGNWGIGRTNDDTPLPLEERFFLGGSNSMRGFARNQVGPANARAWSDYDYPDQLDGLIDDSFRHDSGDRWTATGGEYFALLNVELHYPLEKWDMNESSLVTFVDVGHLDFISPYSSSDSMLLKVDPLFRYCVGVGLRYSTVIGPIAFDLGINPEPLTERGEVWLVPNLSFGSL